MRKEKEKQFQQQTYTPSDLQEISEITLCKPSEMGADYELKTRTAGAYTSRSRVKGVRNKILMPTRPGTTEVGVS